MGPCEYQRLCRGASSVNSSPMSGLDDVRERLKAAAAMAGRDAAAVPRGAVGKTFGPEAITPVIAAGQRVFGENRVQEAKAKWPALKAAHPGLGPQGGGRLGTHEE